MSPKQKIAKQWKLDNKEKVKGYAQKYRDNNKEKIAKYSKQYMLDNKEKKIEYNKKYYLNNKEKLAKYMKKYVLNNKEKIIAYKHQYYLDNKEEISEYHHQYRLDHKEQLVEQNHQYYLDNKEKVDEVNKQYREENKEKVAVQKHRYYLDNVEYFAMYNIKLKYGLTFDDYRKMFEDQKGLCLGCDINIVDRRVLLLGNEEELKKKGIAYDVINIDHDHSFDIEGKLSGNPDSVNGLLCPSCNGKDVLNPESYHYIYGDDGDLKKKQLVMNREFFKQASEKGELK